MATEDDHAYRNATLAKLEERAIKGLFALIERDGGDRKFWVRTAVGMFLVTAGPMILISLFFLGRELGYFE